MSKAESPAKGTGDYLNYSVEVGGTSIEDKFSIVEVTTCSAINSIPSARIVINDGDVADGKFSACDGDTFKPGSDIKISAGYGSTSDGIFSGIIIGLSVAINSHVHSQIIIECRDKSLAMTIAKNNVIYQKQTDSDLISTLVGNTDGLSVTVKDTQTQYHQLIQQNTTDWDFLMSRVNINGYIVSVSNAALTVHPPALSKDPELVVTWGDDLINFRSEMDARYQFSKVEVTGWDISNQKIISKSATAVAGNDQGTSTESDLSSVLGLSAFKIDTSANWQSDELESLAKSRQQQSALARFRGHMVFQGSAKAVPDSLIQVKSVGTRFSGKVYVSEVEHRIVESGWTTKVKFGLSPHFKTKSMLSKQTSTMTSSVEGLQIGLVQKLTGDPADENRILIQIPVLQNEADGVWARLSSFYASDAVGSFFIPEVGDEVLVGYVNNDPNNAVIMGSLYSSKNKPPFTMDKDNSIKGLLTKAKLKLELDDKNKVITLETPNSNQLVISDKGKSILLKDQTGNEVELNKDGMTLKCPKTLKITATDDLELSAKNISIKAKQNLSLDAKSIKQTANQSFSAKAKSQLKITSSGSATLKGSTVNINPP